MILSRGIFFELWTRLIIMDLIYIKCTSLNEDKSLWMFQAKRLILPAVFGVVVELLDSCMEVHFYVHSFNTSTAGNAWVCDQHGGE